MDPFPPTLARIGRLDRRMLEWVDEGFGNERTMCVVFIFSFQLSAIFAVAFPHSLPSLMRHLCLSTFHTLCNFALQLSSLDKIMEAGKSKLIVTGLPLVVTDARERKTGTGCVSDICDNSLDVR